MSGLMLKANDLYDYLTEEGFAPDYAEDNEEMILACPECGSEFKPYPHDDRKKFCCHTCALRFGRRRDALDVDGTRLRRQRYHLRKRLAVIQLLGAVCRRCGFNDARALEVNHIVGGGRAEHRDRRGVNFYNDILMGKRTTVDLELLCANCNVLYEFERGKRPWV